MNMDIQQVIASSPVRLLENKMAGSLGSGKLGVCVAHAGIGKTAFLIQIGIDADLNGKKVLHIALGQTTEHVQSWYETLLNDLLARCAVDNADEVIAEAATRRVIQSFADLNFSAERLEQIIELYRVNMQFTPDIIIIDGYDWEALDDSETAGLLGACKSCAGLMGAALWMSAGTEQDDQPGSSLPRPCNTFDTLIDTAILLKPCDRQVQLYLLRAQESAQTGSEPVMLLHSDTFRLVSPGQIPSAPSSLSAYVLLSGGAQGAEETFGQCAEAWGLREENYTFSGHKPARSRGLVVLSEAELEQGHVSPKYLKAQMHRDYPDMTSINRVIQSIWHQVNTASEVFVVGMINADETVRGGTGWAAELGRHWRKRVFVFDQKKNTWFRWSNNAWTVEEEPRITGTRFTGTGTRDLTDQGREAIRSLFERSFGPPPGV
jgi:hypothetical protein